MLHRGSNFDVMCSRAGPPSRKVTRSCGQEMGEGLHGIQHKNSIHDCERTFLSKSRPSCNSAPMWAPTALSFSGAKNLLIEMGCKLLFASLVPRIIIMPAVQRCT